MVLSRGDIIKSINERKKKELENLSTARAALRERILTDKVLAQSETTFSAEFDGYGDSGTVYSNTSDHEIDEFLNLAVHTLVEFDWYNNEGGGGDITWDVVTDKIIINGYYNVVERVSELEEAEF